MRSVVLAVMVAAVSVLFARRAASETVTFYHVGSEGKPASAEAGQYRYPLGTLKVVEEGGRVQRVVLFTNVAPYPSAYSPQVRMHEAGLTGGGFLPFEVYRLDAFTEMPAAYTGPADEGNRVYLYFLDEPEHRTARELFAAMAKEGLMVRGVVSLSPGMTWIRFMGW